MLQIRNASKANILGAPFLIGLDSVTAPLLVLRQATQIQNRSVYEGVVRGRRSLDNSRVLDQDVLGAEIATRVLATAVCEENCRSVVALKRHILAGESDEPFRSEVSLCSISATRVDKGVSRVDCFDVAMLISVRFFSAATVEIFSIELTKFEARAQPNRFCVSSEA